MDDPDDNFDDLDDFTDGEIAFDDITLTDEEKDVLGELGNISIGTSATTLFALLGQRVIITTPVVYVVKLSEIGDNYEKPCVGIRVDYTAGIKGTNVLLLNHNDVKVITSLMMGWGGDINPDEELNDMDISAIQEAMNQMIGSASTSLASLVNTKIDIATPIASIIDFNRSDLLENLGFDEEYAVAVEFRMEIGTLVDSNIMQLLPMNFARYMVEVMTSSMSPPQEQPKESSKEEKPAPTPDAATDALPSAAKPDTMSQQALANQPETSGPEGSIAMNQTQTYAEQQPGNYAPPPGQQPQYVPQPQVAAQAAQFQSFDVSDVMQQKENIEIIMDVPLEVTVELGRTSRKIRDILEFSPGSIIELNKLAGEPIDILVNGKFVAKGEVVVIDENFGIRITDIVNAEHRI
jgi:flagellar motor switch protein FliN/FliY